MTRASFVHRWARPSSLWCPWSRWLERPTWSSWPSRCSRTSRSRWAQQILWAVPMRPPGRSRSLSQGVQHERTRRALRFQVQSPNQTPEPRSDRPERLTDRQHFHWRGRANILLEVASHHTQQACHTCTDVCPQVIRPFGWFGLNIFGILWWYVVAKMCLLLRKQLQVNCYRNKAFCFNVFIWMWE